MKPRLLLLVLLLLNISVQARMAHLEKGEARLARKDYQGSIKTLTRYLSTEDAQGESARYQAHSLIAQSYMGLAAKENTPEKFITAYHHLLGAKAHAPDSAARERVANLLDRLFPYIYNAGVKAYNLKQYGQAHTFLRTALKIKPNHSLTAMSLGYLAWKTGDSNLAYHYWSKVPEQGCDVLIIPAERKTYERSCLLLAQWHYENGQADSAQGILASGQEILGYTPAMQAFAQKMLVSR